MALRLDNRTRRHTPSMNPPRKQWELSEIYDSHQEIIRLAVLGTKITDIARQVGRTKESVQMILDSKIVQDQVAYMQASRDVECIDVAVEIQKTAPTALRLLQDVIKGTGEGEGASINLRTATAKDMLDRAGHGAVKKFQGQVANAVFTKEDIDELKSRRKSG